MKLNKPLQITLVVIMGILAAFILLEAGLRVMGVIYQHTHQQKDPIAIVGDKDHFNVLCTGASWTAGCGAPSGKDYPSQLEEILNERVDGKTFTVFRRAIVSQNTAQVLDRLESDIDETQPNLVIFLVGVANGWNHWGFLDYKKADKALASSVDYIENIKTFKLTKILASDVADKLRRKQLGMSKAYNEQRKKEEQKLRYLKERIEEYPDNGILYLKVGTAYLRRQNGPKAEEYYLKGIEKDPEVSGNYTGMGGLSMARGDFPEAIDWYKKGIKVDPSNGNNYAGIGWAYYRQREYKKAIEWYEKALEIDPSGVTRAAWYGGYVTISHAYNRLGMYEKAKEYADKASGAIDSVASNRREKSMMYAHQDIRAWIKSDFTEMVAICRSQDIPVIMQTFPNDGYDKFGIGINQAIRETAQELGVPFVDQQELFIEYFEDKDLDRSKYFEFPSTDRYHVTGEGHCNEMGYRLMAQNLYNKIREEGIFSTD